jgi:hypothetical protein
MLNCEGSGMAHLVRRLANQLCVQADLGILYLEARGRRRDSCIVTKYRSQLFATLALGGREIISFFEMWFRLDHAYRHTADMLDRSTFESVARAHKAIATTA